MKNVTERKREALDRVMRDAACQATIQVLREAGLEGVTMERVANVAGVAKGTLYNYFEGKQALLRHVLEETARPILEGMRQAAELDLPTDLKIVELAMAILGSMEENRETFRLLEEAKLINPHPGGCSGPASDAEEQPRQRALAIVRGVMEEGIDTGMLRDVSADISAEFFIATLTVFKPGAVDQTGTLSTEERAELAASLFLRGLASD